jgi:hypothetical protein
MIRGQHLYPLFHHWTKLAKRPNRHMGRVLESGLSDWAHHLIM